jgi:voltage-gated potassium channel Kch
MAFSFNPEAVRQARTKRLPVVFGGGSNPDVLKAATASPPRAFVLTLRSHPQTIAALTRIRTNWPGVPIFAMCIDIARASEAKRLGATLSVPKRASAGVDLGDAILRSLMDTSYVDLVFLEQEMQLMVKDAVAEKAKAGSEAGARGRNGASSGTLVSASVSRTEDTDEAGEGDVKTVDLGDASGSKVRPSPLMHFPIFMCRFLF